MLEAHVREILAPEGPEPVPALPPPPRTAGEPACPECGGVIRTRKAARLCSAKCRAAASRQRRLEADVKSLGDAEVALVAALDVVRDLRAAVVRRGTP